MRRLLSIAVYVVIRSMVQPSSAPGVGRRCLTPIHTRTSSLPRRTIASSTPRVSRASWNQAGPEAPAGSTQYTDLPNSVREGSLEQPLRELFCFRNVVELDHSLPRGDVHHSPSEAARMFSLKLCHRIPGEVAEYSGRTFRDEIDVWDGPRSFHGPPSVPYAYPRNSCCNTLLLHVVFSGGIQC